MKEAWMRTGRPKQPLTLTNEKYDRWLIVRGASRGSPGEREWY
jgi:hypothetical protein